MLSIDQVEQLNKVVAGVVSAALRGSRIPLAPGLIDQASWSQEEERRVFNLVCANLDKEPSYVQTNLRHQSLPGRVKSFDGRLVLRMMGETLVLGPSDSFEGGGGG